MKSVIFIAIIVTCWGAYSYGLPASERDVVYGSNKWEALAKIAKEFRRTITMNAQAICDTAVADNKAVGAEITKKTKASLSDAKALIDKLDDAITAQSLTLAEANLLFQQGETFFYKYVSKILGDIVMLSLVSQGKIYAILSRCHGTTMALEATANAILIVGAPGGVSTDTASGVCKWKMVSKISQKVRKVIEDCGHKTSKIANKDNAEAGTKFEDLTIAAVSECIALIDQLDAAIQAQTLTLEEADEIFRQNDEVVYRYMNDIQAALQKLSLKAQTFITAKTTKARGEVVSLQSEIKAILNVGILDK